MCRGCIFISAARGDGGIHGVIASPRAARCRSSIYISVVRGKTGGIHGVEVRQGLPRCRGCINSPAFPVNLQRPRVTPKLRFHGAALIVKGPYVISPGRAEAQRIPPPLLTGGKGKGQSAVLLRFMAAHGAISWQVGLSPTRVGIVRYGSIIAVPV